MQLSRLHSISATIFFTRGWLTLSLMKSAGGPITGMDLSRSFTLFMVAWLTRGWARSLFRILVSFMQILRQSPSVSELVSRSFRILYPRRK